MTHELALVTSLSDVNLIVQVTPPQPASTTTSCLYWSAWYGGEQPSELGQVVSYWEMSRMVSVCGQDQVKSMQCRAKDSKLPYDQTGQVQ